MDKKNLILIAVLVVGLALVAIGLYSIFQPAQSTQSGSNPASQPTTSNGIEIPFSVAWTNTNIQVHKGQNLVIKASGKGIWKNIANSNPNAYPKPYEESNPDGTPPIDTKDY